MVLFLRSATRRLESATVRKMCLDRSVTSAGLTAGGMLSIRSVCPVAAAPTDLFLSAVTSKAAASVALASWADAVISVA